jgi:hypothetical protein
MNWARTQRVAVWVAAISFSAFFLFVIVGLFLRSPTLSERLLSVALICISGSVSAFTFAFLPRQTAELTINVPGFVGRLSGASAAFLIMFAVLQFGVRGTSNVYIELYQDDDFKQRWQPESGQAPPEFAANLRNYTVLAYPTPDVIRLFNLPIFEAATITVRTPKWAVTKIASDERSCNVSGARVSGWCTELKVALKSVDCIERWRGGGEISAGKFDDTLKYFLAQIGHHYPVKLKLPIGGKDTERALQAAVDRVAFNDKDFCTAVNPVKVELEQKLKQPVRINLACAWIGLSVGSDPFPELTEEPGGWKKPC